MCEQALRGFHATASFSTIGAVVHPYAIDDRKILVKAIQTTKFSPHLDSFTLKAGKNSLSVVEPTTQPRWPMA